jgi:hypothetical protein
MERLQSTRLRSKNCLRLKSQGLCKICESADCRGIHMSASMLNLECNGMPIDSDQVWRIKSASQRQNPGYTL